MKPVMDVLRMLWLPPHNTPALEKLTKQLDSQDNTVQTLQGASMGLEQQIRRMAGELQ